MKRKQTAIRLLSLVALIAVSVSAGCAPIIGWWVNVFAPPQKVDAIYKPPSGKTIFVFVDDMIAPVSHPNLKAALTEQLNQQLVENKVATRTIPYEDLLTLMSATPQFNELAIGEVGKKLQADIVLYVQVNAFSLKDDEGIPLWHGRLETDIRFVDVSMGRLWPDDRLGGYPVRPIEEPAGSHPSSSYGEVLAEVLARKMADRIAKLFYDHKVSPAEAAKEEARR